MRQQEWAPVPPSAASGVQERCVGRAQADGAATPGWAPGATPAVGATPAGKKQRSRWDETPAGVAVAPGATPMVGVGATPFGMTPGMTPMGGADMATPSPGALGKVPMTAEQYQARRPRRPTRSARRVCCSAPVAGRTVCSLKELAALGFWMRVAMRGPKGGGPVVASEGC